MELPWPSHCQVERPKRTRQAERPTLSPRNTRTEGVVVWAEKPCSLAYSLAPGFGLSPGPSKMAPDPTGPFLTNVGSDVSGPQLKPARSE